MPLSEKLKWVEVDLPDIFAYKEDLLKDVKPVCQMERIAGDLLNEEFRNILFARLNKGSQKVLIVSEGFFNLLNSGPGKFIGGMF